MPISKKTVLPLNLARFDVLIEDTSEYSEYFQVTNLPPEFTGGRNSFLLGGSDYLQEGSEIQLEIIDAGGNPIYQSLVPNYVEGNSRLISVEIYDDTVPGIATIVVMGKAETTVTGESIPVEWQDTYNVRWVKRILIDYNLNNVSPLRFRNQPEVILEEKRFFNINSSSFDTIINDITASLSPLLFSSIQTGYSIDVEAPTTLSAEYNTGTITGSLKINNTATTINIPITKLLNKFKAFSSGYTIPSPINNGIIKQIFLKSGSYTTNIDSITYPITSSAKIQYSVVNTSSVNIPISYASLRVSNLDTVSGEIYKFRIYTKVTTNTADYKLIGDVPVTTEEIFVSSSIRGNIPIGDIFQANNVQQNWYADELLINDGARRQVYTVSGSPSYYNSALANTTYPILSSDDILMSSIYANIPIDLTTGKFAEIISQSGYFIGTKQYYVLFPTSEYTLTFDAFYKKTSQSVSLIGNDPVVNIYLIGGGDTNVVSLDPLGQKIGEIRPTRDTQWVEQQQFNFFPNVATAGNLGLRFIVSNGFWNFSNISIKPASDPQFSPDEVLLLIPNVEYHNELLQYKVEFFDINNNSANVSATSIPVFFTGSAIDLGTLP
jgi:hypothetical protein